MYDVYLTKNGAKYYNELTTKDYVRTFDDIDYEWSRVKNLYSSSIYSNDVVCDNGFCATASSMYREKEGLLPYDELTEGMLIKEYVEPRVYTTTQDDYYELLGAFLADGHVKNQNGNISRQVEFHMEKEWKVDKLKELTENLDYDYNISQRQDESYLFVINNGELSYGFRMLYDTVHDSKRFPSDVWEDTNALCNILRGLMFDASKDGHRWSYGTSGFMLAVESSYALGMLGIKHTLFKKELSLQSSRWKDHYIIRFGKDYNPYNDSKISFFEDNGVDFCPVVESGNGYPIVGGLGGLILGTDKVY